MKKALTWIRLLRASRMLIFQSLHWRTISLNLSGKTRADGSLSVYRFGWILAVVLNVWALGVHAQEPRYRYVSLDQTELPTGFTVFYPSAIQDSGRVYGSICDTAQCNVTRFAYVADGKAAVLLSVPPGSFTGPVNARGTIGASIQVDLVNGIYQAALVQGGQIELVPPQPGEVLAFVIALNDNGTALIQSYNASGGSIYVLFRGGNATPINFGPNITNPFFSFIGTCRCINNNEIIEGTEGPGLYNGARGFRFDTRNGNATILDPFPGDPTETLAWGQAINQAGLVLGYSFVSGTPYHERIGVWGNNGVFYTYFVETIDSSQLLFNDNNLIVITEVSGSPVSYIVPQPGVRLNLADVVVNLPVGQNLASITGLNNGGDMIGFSSTGANFLLQRLGEGDMQGYPTSVVNDAIHAIPPGVATMRNRLLSQFGRVK